MGTGPFNCQWSLKFGTAASLSARGWRFAAVGQTASGNDSTNRGFRFARGGGRRARSDDGRLSTYKGFGKQMGYDLVRS